MSATVWVTVLLVIIVCFDVTQAQFEDRRCKCICPADPGSKHRVNVTVVSVPAVECRCEYITGKSELECLRCECKYEVRSTIIIQVSVIFVLCLIAFLFVYLIIMLIKDPGILKRRSDNDHRRLTNESVSQEAVNVAEGSYLRRRISVVESAQKRWRHNVQQQRQDVFEDHTMLS